MTERRFVHGHNALKGVPRTEEVKEKVRQSVLKWHKKIGHSKETIEKIRKSQIKNRQIFREAKLGDKNPAKRLDVRIKMSLAQRGEKSFRWKGGITKLYAGIRTLWEYKEWHKKVRERDNWTCVECQKHGGKIEVDHIIPMYEIIMKFNIKTLEDARNCKDLWDASNGRTLCRPCHELTPTYGRFVQ